MLVENTRIVELFDIIGNMKFLNQESLIQHLKKINANDEEIKIILEMY